MTDSIFVGREPEIERLENFLDRALNGQGQIAFVSGEAGMGKTAMLQAFAARAQQRHAGLIVAVGNCNAQTGVGQAFLPFREILGTLTGDFEDKLAAGVISDENADRLQKLLARSALLLLDVAPDLIELIPGGKLLTTAVELGMSVSQSLTKQAKIEDKLEKIAARKSAALELVGNPVEQEQIFEQCHRFLHGLAGEQPLLVVLDDLHWADASSLSLLFHLGRRLADSNVLIIGAYRPDELAVGRGGQRHPLEKVQAEFKRYRGDIIVPLAPGDERTIRRFVDAYIDAQPNLLGYDFRQEICRHTRGNPLFVAELLRDMRERGDIVQNEHGLWCVASRLDWNTIPARVEGVIEERIERLGKDLRETLTLASVEGEQFTAEVVSRLQQLQDREIIRRLSGDLSKQHRLVETVGLTRTARRRLSRYRFSHNLVHHFLYNHLDEVELAYLHEDVGNVLEDLYADQLDEIAVQLAWHFQKAGLADKAAQYHRRAGEMAARRYAHDEALSHLSAALDLTPESDHAARSAILLARETVYGWQGKRQAQWADLEALSALAEQLPLSERYAARAEVLLRQANLARLTGDYQAGLNYAQQAVPQAEAAGNPAQEARAYAMWGRIFLRTGKHREADEWLQLALEQATEINDHPLMAQIAHSLGLNQFRIDRYEQAQAHLRRAEDLYEQIGDRQGEIRVLQLQGVIEIRRGNYSAAIDFFEQALAAADRIGWNSHKAFILTDLGSCHVEAGDYEQARRFHEQAVEMAREVGDREGESISLGALGLIEHRQGRPAAALPLFEQSLNIKRLIGYRRGEGYTLTHLGHALLDTGDLVSARDAFSQALAIRRQLDPESGMIMDTLAGLAAVAQAEGDLTAARTQAEEILAWIEGNGVERIEFPVQVYLICYRVMAAAVQAGQIESARAEHVSRAGLALLEQQAGAITDEAMRRRFLTEIPFNRALQEAR